MIDLGWRARWQGLSSRERAMVVVAAGTVLLGLLYAVGVEPAWRDRARIAQSLPLLQSQQLEVEALAAQARALRARGIASDPAQALPAVAERSLTRAGLAATVLTRPGGGIAVQARNVAAPALFAWVETFSRESRIPVVDARVERASAAGQVDADVTFATGAR